MKITIYGKPKCSNCALAKRVLKTTAEYRPHESIWDDFDDHDAQEIVTATNGSLPIIVVETERGRLVLGMGAGGHGAGCDVGACKI